MDPTTQRMIHGGGSLGQFEQVFDTPGTYSWICPEGVTSVSIVAVGGPGFDDTIQSSFTTQVIAYSAGGNYVGTGGGRGGSGGLASSTSGFRQAGGGGGGAGGYTGNGGDGSDGFGTSGSGSRVGGAGGGVGLYGQGPSGSGGVITAGTSSFNRADDGSGGGGGGGSGAYSTSFLTVSGRNGGTGSPSVYGNSSGTSRARLNAESGGSLAWKNNISVTPGNSYQVKVASGGAVRIIWPGNVRQFPSTNVNFF